MNKNEDKMNKKENLKQKKSCKVFHKINFRKMLCACKCIIEIFTRIDAGFIAFCVLCVLPTIF